MKKIIQKGFRVASYVSWPLFGLFLHNSKRVRVLVEAEGSIVLGRSSVGTQQWSIPGGGVVKNENPLDATTRELYEETGIKITTEQLRCIGEDRLPRNKMWPKSDIIFYYVVLPKKQPIKVRRPLEIIEAKWFPLTKLPVSHSETLTIALDMANIVKKN